MKLHNAEVIADLWVDALEPYCERITIAGSIRREKEEVKDIEIVAIPKKRTDMFSEMAHKEPLPITEYLLSLTKIKLVKNGIRFKQIDTGIINIDLFLVFPPAQWGAILTIRTGPADFSKKIVTKKKYGGFMPSNMKQKNGALWNYDQRWNKESIVITRTETEYFKALGIDWVEPKDRGELP